MQAEMKRLAGPECKCSVDIGVTKPAVKQSCRSCNRKAIGIVNHSILEGLQTLAKLNGRKLEVDNQSGEPRKAEKKKLSSA